MGVKVSLGKRALYLKEGRGSRRAPASYLARLVERMVESGETGFVMSLAGTTPSRLKAELEGLLKIPVVVREG